MIQVSVLIGRLVSERDTISILPCFALTCKKNKKFSFGDFFSMDDDRIVEEKEGRFIIIDEERLSSIYGAIESLRGISELVKGQKTPYGVGDLTERYKLCFVIIKDFIIILLTERINGEEFLKDAILEIFNLYIEKANLETGELIPLHKEFIKERIMERLKNLAKKLEKNTYEKT